MCYVPDETKPLIVFSGFEPTQQVTQANAKETPVLSFTRAYDARSLQLVWSTDTIGGTSVTTNGQNMWVTNSKANDRKASSQREVLIWGKNYYTTFKNYQKSWCNMIHVVSSTDGRDLGSLVRPGEYGLGEMGCVRWCSKTSSLIVCHREDKSIEWHINMRQPITPNRKISRIEFQ